MTLGPGLFRLILAALVVLTHLSRTKIGITAVMVFFLLSGYWVTRMYVEKYRHAARPMATFYLSRFLRLWPAFACAVILALLISRAAGFDPDPRQLFAIPMLGVASHTHDPLNISWSLDIEMQFYLLVPVLIPLLESATWRRATCLAIIAVSGLGWSLHHLTGIETVAGYLPAFACGALIYLCRFRVGRRGALASLAAFTLAGAVLAGLPATRGLILAPGLPETAARSGALLWGLILVPFVAWNLRAVSSRFDRAMGDFSYSLYLVHFPIIATASRLAGGDLTDAQKVAVLGLITGLSLTFFALVDRPLERWRERVVTIAPADTRPT